MRPLERANTAPNRNPNLELTEDLKNLNTVPSSKLLYHRLDLLGQPSACLHFKQLATLGKPCTFPFPLWSS